MIFFIECRVLNVRHACAHPVGNAPDDMLVLARAKQLLWVASAHLSHHGVLDAAAHFEKNALHLRARGAVFFGCSCSAPLVYRALLERAGMFVGAAV